MSLSTMSDDQKLILCRRYFYGGFACLPLLWLVNFCWFFNHAFKHEVFPQQEKIRNYVIWSGAGVLVWTVILLAWNIYFQMNRLNLSWSDDLLFILPTGIP